MNATTIVSKSQSFKKNNLYIINFEDNENMREFLIEMGILAEEEGGITLNVSIPDMLISTDLRKKDISKVLF